jgi:hypothetical protein
MFRKLILRRFLKEGNSESVPVGETSRRKSDTRISRTYIQALFTFSSSAFYTEHVKQERLSSWSPKNRVAYDGEFFQNGTSY